MTQEKLQINNIIRLLTSKNPDDNDNGYILGESIFGLSKDELDMILYNRTGVSNLPFRANCESLEMPSSLAAPIMDCAFANIRFSFNMDFLEKKSHWIFKLFGIDKIML